MNEKTFEIKYTNYQFLAEMPEADRQLIQKAREALLRGYAPYSGFRVGAAVLLQNGSIITGNNQENAAYPSGLCAERTALFYASSQYPNIPIIAIAVSTFGNGLSDEAKPCGACRQVMSEYEDLSGKPLRIILDGTDQITIFDTIDCLLPFRFRQRDMEGVNGKW
ncbi:MAG: cytidine deaminase [Mariniphaga sp.]